MVGTHDDDDGGDGVTQHGGHTPKEVGRDIKPWFTVYLLILDISATINYWHLSKQGIRWPVSHGHIAGSSLQLIEVTCFFKVDRWPIAGFSNWIAGSCQVNLFKTGQDCSEEPNYNFFFYKNAQDSGLKINWIINFLLKIVFCCFLLCIWWLSKLKTEAQTENDNTKLQNSNQNSTFSWVNLTRFWTPRAPELRF